MYTEHKSAAPGPQLSPHQVGKILVSPEPLMPPGEEPLLLLIPGVPVFQRLVPARHVYLPPATARGHAERHQGRSLCTAYQRRQPLSPTISTCPPHTSPCHVELALSPITHSAPPAPALPGLSLPLPVSGWPGAAVTLELMAPRRRGAPAGGRSTLMESLRRGWENKFQVLIDPRYTALLGVCLCLAELVVTHWVIQRVPCECDTGVCRMRLVYNASSHHLSSLHRH